VDKKVISRSIFQNWRCDLVCIIESLKRKRLSRYSSRSTIPIGSNA
jgi:hypothetical protein